MMKLRRFIERASQQIDVAFAKTGLVPSHYQVVAMSGHVAVVPFPDTDDKDRAAAIMREFFAANPTQRYLFIAEAWTLDSSKEEGPTLSILERDGVQSISAHPRRREVVMFTAEDRDEGMLLGLRTIIRPHEGKPYLGPFELDEPETMEGRMVGLLPRAQPLPS